jgi:hypothetical protein
MKVVTFTSSVPRFRFATDGIFDRFQVSGVRCQQLKSTRWIGVAHEMDFLSPVLTFSRNLISVQDSGFVFTDT